MATAYKGDLRTRMHLLFERLGSGNQDTYGSEMDAFTKSELALSQRSYTDSDLRTMFLGSGKQRGLFLLAGDASGMKHGRHKPYSRHAVLSLFQMMSTEKEPIMTDYFRKMPVEDLRRLKLWKHLMYGDAESRMAAFRLCRVLYHSYPEDQFKLILNNKTRALDIFHAMHAQWLRDHPVAGQQAAPVPAAKLDQIPLPPAPVVEASVQPIMQEVVQPVKQTVVQPVVQQPNIVQVEKPAIHNAPITAAMREEAAVINAPVADTEVSPELLPPKPVVEATVQKVVQPVVQPVQQTVVQPVIQQPEIRKVEREAIINAPVEKPMMMQETVINKPVGADEGIIPADALPARPVVEAATQPIVQPVLQQVKQTVLQPVVIQPEVVTVQKPEQVLPAQTAPTIEKDVLIAPPMVAKTTEALQQLNLQPVAERRTEEPIAQTTNAPAGNAHLSQIPREREALSQGPVAQTTNAPAGNADVRGMSGGATVAQTDPAFKSSPAAQTNVRTDAAARQGA